MTEYLSPRRKGTNQNPWARGQKDRNRNIWSPNHPKRLNNAHLQGESNVASPPESKTHPWQRTVDIRRETKETSRGTTPVDTSPNPWVTEPAPVDVNWGDIESSMAPALQEEWEYQDPDAPLQLTSLNLAAYCNPVDPLDEFYPKAKSSQEYHQSKKKKRIEDWVMHGTEEKKPPNLKFKGARQLWRPFSNRAHLLPGAYS